MGEDYLVFEAGALSAERGGRFVAHLLLCAGCREEAEYDSDVREVLGREQGR
ncbi:MAG: hypothetical protein L6R43_00535 [Planctomycetes bacterium]|nr:hypothetical protein [Planctomycetota bacterium]